MSDITTRNFAAQCAHALKSESRFFKEGNIWLLQAKAIASATHFILPKDGVILDDELRGLKCTRNLRLPFKSITTEFVTTEGSALVILASETDTDDEEIVDITVQTFSKGDYRIQWLPSTGYIKNRSNAWLEHGQTGSSFSSEFHARTTINSDWDLGLRIGYRSILELCEALTCSNVTHEIHHASASPERNTKRARKGKFPLWEYRVLTIPTAKSSRDFSGPFGTHASPRQHLRMGHIRRHPTAGNIWVNSCVVGNSSQGIIEKSYDASAHQVRVA